MKLKALLSGLDVRVVGSKGVEVFGVALDSRRVAPRDLFVAQRGSERDGAAFVEEAVLAGAGAVVTPVYNPFLKVCQVVVDDPARLVPLLAARFYKEPSRELWVVGVTGSKGKTTSCYLIHHLLGELGREPGLLGTVELVVGKRRLPSTLTTQDLVTNQKLLREMVECGAKAAVLEVSSHGLAQKRVEGIAFDLALFTNLVPDHLDYHKTVEAYAAEKRKLFQMAPVGIYNADSPWSAFMRGEGECCTFGIETAADVRAEEISSRCKETLFRVQGELFSTRLSGKFNLYNLLGAIAVGIHLKVDLARLAAIFQALPPVPGRLEEVPNQLGMEIFVDYAHTGAALDQVLQALRERGPKRLLVVFGAGGGRDPARRREMGLAAAKWADLAIVTTDNPREEDPEQICQEILSVMPIKRAQLVLDRTQAIQRAIEVAEPGDTVLIAGKGHEKVQIFGSRSVPFDDVAVAKEALAKRTILL